MYKVKNLKPENTQTFNLLWIPRKRITLLMELFKTLQKYIEKCNSFNTKTKIETNEKCVLSCSGINILNPPILRRINKINVSTSI